MEQFEDIYKKYYKKLYLFLLKLSDNQVLAEELTQETLYKAFLHIEQYSGKASIYSWLCAIAKNAWFAELKRGKSILNLEDISELKSGANLEEEALNRYMKALMRQEIMRLPEPYVSVCMLRIYAELPFADIAAQFSKTESWAKVTFFRGKMLLTERMKGYL